MLVVTKADLGEVALRARRDLSAALRSLGERETAVVSVSAVPARGRAGSSERSPRLTPTAPARTSARTQEGPPPRRARGLRRRARRARPARLGGRRSAVRLLAEQDAALEQPALLGLLESHAG